MVGLGPFLRDDVSLSLDVIPDHKPIQVAASGEKDSAAGRFGQAITKANIVFGLRPAGEQEHIDDDAIPLAEQAFTERDGLGTWIGRVEHEEL